MSAPRVCCLACVFGAGAAGAAVTCRAIGGLAATEWAQRAEAVAHVRRAGRLSWRTGDGGGAGAFAAARVAPLAGAALRAAADEVDAQARAAIEVSCAARSERAGDRAASIGGVVVAL